MQTSVSQVCLKVFPCNFLLNSGESPCCCDQFHTYSQWFAAKFKFLNFSIAGKCSKMLKISCFMQNQGTSGMPEGIPCNFFAQQL